MIGIIMEGVLFVALIATVAALLFYALLRWTPQVTGSAMPMIQLPAAGK